MSVLPYNREPITNIIYNEYPVASTDYKTYYLEKSGKLSLSQPQSPDSNSYNSEIVPRFLDDDEEELTFTFTFTEATWLVGYSVATLYMSCTEHDDLDVFVQLRKVDSKGQVLQHMNVPVENLVPAVPGPKDVPDSCFYKYLGPTGVLRASHAITKLSESEPFLPEYSHDRQEKVSPGTVVRLEVPIWPGGMAFDAGESLMLKVAGHPMNMMELLGLGGNIPVENVGRHIVYFGGEHSSSLTVPLVRPSVTSGKEMGGADPVI